jgi:hypothetical protein
MVRIVLRADSGFAREALMRPPIAARSAPLETEPQGGWCETNAVDYVLGLARNARLVREIEAELALAAAEAERTREPARRFKDFRYQTLDSWSRERRVVGPSRAPARARCADRIGRSPMAEQLVAGSGAPSPNPRVVVTSLAVEAWAPRPLYEELYRARGEMENRIKECQLDLFADRTSAGTMRSNRRQRRCRPAVARVDGLRAARRLRRIALPATRLARATAGTIRLRLLKLGALARVSVRRVTIAGGSCAALPSGGSGRARWPPAIPGSRTGPSPTRPS